MSIATCSLQQDVLLIECFTEKSTLFPHCFQSQIVVRHGLMTRTESKVKYQNRKAKKQVPEQVSRHHLIPKRDLFFGAFVSDEAEAEAEAGVRMCNRRMLACFTRSVSAPLMSPRCSEISPR